MLSDLSAYHMDRAGDICIPCLHKEHLEHVHERRFSHRLRVVDIPVMIYASTNREIAAPFVPLYLPRTAIFEHPNQVIGIQRAIEHGKREKDRHGIISENRVLDA